MYVPERYNVETAPNGWVFWSDEKGNRFIDIKIEFSHEMSQQQKREIIEHFTHGLYLYDKDITRNIVYINFYKSNILELTIQGLKEDPHRSILKLIVELEKDISIKKMNNTEKSQPSQSNNSL